MASRLSEVNRQLCQPSRAGKEPEGSGLGRFMREREACELDGQFVDSSAYD